MVMGAGLLAAVAPALDLTSFLRRTLEYAIHGARADGGSLFIYAPATRQLHLRAMIDPRDEGQPKTFLVAPPDRSSAPAPRVALGVRDGVVGRAFSNPALSDVVKQPELTEIFREFAMTQARDLRAIASAVVRHAPGTALDRPQAVVCLDYRKHADLPDDLSSEEHDGFRAVALEVNSPQFASAFRRVAFQQAIVDIQAAGHRPASLRHEVGAFLGALFGAFRAEGRPEPATAYLQLVDRRRGVIRTVQGVGHKLAFQVSVSHGLDSKDIQAQVVKGCRPLMIVGRDEWFDGNIHKEHDHERYTRLWVPLFPFPIARWCALLSHSGDLNLGRAQAERLREALTWGEPTVVDWDDDKGQRHRSRRQQAEWTLDPPPVPALVWGTLEIGYERDGQDQLSLTPLTPDLGTWAAGQAYLLSERLFRATLPGALETIGSAASGVVDDEPTCLTIAMPDWTHPEHRRYEGHADWPVAVPCQGGSIDDPPRTPVELRLGDRRISVDTLDSMQATETERLLVRRIDESVRVALRLDDHVADQYVLLEGRRDDLFVGTHHPDPGLAEILGEICREAGALACIYVPFERRRMQGQTRMVSIAPPTAWSVQPDPPPDVPQDLLAVMQAVAQQGRAEARTGPSEARVHSLLIPLELSDVVVVVDLRFPSEAALDGSRRLEIEGRVARWVHRLSLRHLAISNRYASLMLRLRHLVGDARRDAQNAAGGRRLEVLVQKLLADVSERLSAPGAVLTLYHKTMAGAPDQVERFWYANAGHGAAVEGMGSAVFLNDRADGPARQVLLSGDCVLVLPPGAARRAELSEPVNRLLLQRVEDWRADEELRPARVLEGIVALAREESPRATTMLVCPVRDPQAPETELRGALTLFLADAHHLSHSQERLLVEFGGLIADALAQARAADEAAFRRHHETHVQELRRQFGNADTESDVVGALFRGMRAETDGPAPSTGWRLATDAVVWIPSPDGRELVARSGRGRGLECLGERRTLVRSREHPLSSWPDWAATATPAPSAPSFQPLLAEIRRDAESPILKAYATLKDRPWLLSFPAFEPDGQRAAVVDLLLDRLPRPEEVDVLREVLEQLAVAFGVALDSVRNKRLIAFETRLARLTREALAEFRAQDVYRALVEAVREELACSECDLYVERNGRMLLHTTTRAVDSRSETDRALLWLAPHDGPEPLGRCLFTKRGVLEHARSEASGTGHLSEPLSEFLKSDSTHERLATPLMGENDQVWGLLAVRGPVRILSESDARSARPPKVTPHFNRRHLEQLAKMAAFIQHAAVMASMAERRSWLIEEVQHSMGQPLQIARGLTDQLIREVYRDAPVVPVRGVRTRLAHAFDIARAAQENLAAFAKISQDSQWERESIALGHMLYECCEIMRYAAQIKQCGIDTRRVRPIPTVVVHAGLVKVAIVNLLDNAIKYSYRDKDIRVTLSEDQGQIRLQVYNFGIGIPRLDRPRIFEPHFRSRVPDRPAQRGGSGIGLVTVRHAIERVHAGRIMVASNPVGGGPPADTAEDVAKKPYNTTFTILLNRGKLEELAAVAQRSASHEPA